MADPRVNEPPRGEAFVRVGHRRAVHTQRGGEISCRGQLRAGRYPPGLDARDELILELHVKRRFGLTIQA